MRMEGNYILWLIYKLYLIEDIVYNIYEYGWRCEVCEDFKNWRRCLWGDLQSLRPPKQENSSTEEIQVKCIRILSSKENEGIPSCALREISILKQLNHPNIIKY